MECTESGSTTFTGGCACGAIRYESCSSEPVLTSSCHCLDCQKAGGSAYASCLMVPAADFGLTGEPKYYTVTANSGYPIVRGFCSECGSHVLAKLPYKPRIIIIHAKSLNEPSWHRPAADIFASRAQPWDHMDPDLPKSPQLPPVPDSPLFEIQRP